MSPSQELAIQILKVAQVLLGEEHRHRVQQCIGGANVHRQLAAMKKLKPWMVVGTPGRLASLIQHGDLTMDKTRVLVIDEADQLVGRQFLGAMKVLWEEVGRKVGKRQVLLASATMTSATLDKARQWQPDILHVSVEGMRKKGGQQAEGRSGEQLASEGDKELLAQEPACGTRVRADGGPLSPDIANNSTAPMGVAPQIRHYFVLADRIEDKADVLRRCLNALKDTRVLLFVNLQETAAQAEEWLTQRVQEGMQVGFLHGNLSAVQRSRVVQSFRQGAVRVLAVSDLMARGLDLPACDVVIMLELPQSHLQYAHRAGRTGRWGRPGRVICIITPREVQYLTTLVARLKVGIRQAKVYKGAFLTPPEEEGQRRP